MEGALEEFALQSLVYSMGLRFAQLSDMGERDGLENGLQARGDHVPPLTKTERRLPSAHTAQEGAVSVH